MREGKSREGEAPPDTRSQGRESPSESLAIEPGKSLHEEVQDTEGVDDELSLVAHPVLLLQVRDPAVQQLQLPPNDVDVHLLTIPRGIEDRLIR